MEEGGCAGTAEKAPAGFCFGIEHGKAAARAEEIGNSHQRITLERLAVDRTTKLRVREVVRERRAERRRREVTVSERRR